MPDRSLSPAGRDGPGHTAGGVPQSRGLSLVEALTNVLVGYVLAVTGQLVLFPVLGLDATVRQSLQIGALFTVVSLVRAYVLRRVFERLSRPGFSSNNRRG